MHLAAISIIVVVVVVVAAAAVVSPPLWMAIDTVYVR